MSSPVQELIDNAIQTEPTMSPDGKLGPIKLIRLKQTHPRLNLTRVRTLQALYRGGHHLLDDADVMRRVFPKYTYESPGVYAERCARAYYENMFALVINQVSAGLAQDPVRIEEPKKVDVSTSAIDPYWTELLENATALTDDGSGARTFDQVMRDVAVEALVTGWAWVQVDLPKEDVEYASLREQEESGGLRAYVVPWATDQVTDWEEIDGRLVWVRTYQCETRVPDPSVSREDKLHVWTIWTVDGWYRYEILQRKNVQMPGDETLIPVKEKGSHTFGRVPWTRFDLARYGGAHLHVGDVIESLCRNYFNRQNGEAFQWTQYNYQQLYEFLGPEVPGIDTMISEAQQDPTRAQRRRAPGIVHVRGNEDDAKFVGPEMAGAETGRNAMQDLRDSILRITAQMALAQDTSGAMIRRSGDSKRQDSVAQEIVLGAIGKKLITAANSVGDLLAAGRGDVEAPDFVGYERFNVTDAEQLINQDVLLEQIPIESARFQIERKFQLACVRLGDNLKSEHKEEIRSQLETAITQDSINSAAFAAKGLDENGKPLKPEPPFGGDEEKKEEEE